MIRPKSIFVLLAALTMAKLSWSQDLGEWTDSYVKGLAPAKHFRGTIALGHRQNKAHVSSEHAATALALRRCAGRVLAPLCIRHPPLAIAGWLCICTRD